MFKSILFCICMDEMVIFNMIFLMLFPTIFSCPIPPVCSPCPHQLTDNIQYVTNIPPPHHHHSCISQQISLWSKEISPPHSTSSHHVKAIEDPHMVTISNRRLFQKLLYSYLIFHLRIFLFSKNHAARIVLDYHKIHYLFLVGSHKIRVNILHYLR